MVDHRIRVSLGALAAALLMPQIASAQERPAAPPAADQTGGVPDIVVTAQKRAENVQNVPIAISAFTSEALKERAVSDVSALTSISPNVTLDSSTPFSGSTAVLGASIRGIGSADFAFNIDQAVGVYLDGVYLGRSVGANQDLLDVERIEILKGPQGTLFGRNTIGGAVSIVTHDPGDQFRFVGDLTGGSYSRFQARGTVDVPIATDLSSSVSFNLMRRDGYQHRIPYPSSSTYVTDGYQSFVAAGYNSNGDRQGGDNNWSVRTKLKYNGASFKATLAFDYTNVDQESTPNTVLGTTENTPGPFGGLTANDLGPAMGYPNQTALDVVTGSSGFLFAGLYNFCISSTAAQIAARNATNLCGPRTSVQGFNTLPALAGTGLPGSATPRLRYDSRFMTGNIDTTYANGNNYSKVKQYGISLTLEKDFGPNFQIKSISAYRQVDFNAGVDLDGSPLEFLQTSFTVNQHQWSQELQFNGSALDDRLKFTFGGYYFNEAGGLHDYVTFAEGLLQVDGPGRIDTLALAGYGQVDFRLSDFIGFTLGGRYTHEHKQYFGGQADDNGFNYKLFNCPVAGGLPTAACGALIGFPITSNNSAQFSYGSNLGATLANLVDYYPATPNSQDFNNFSPKAGIQIHPSERVMIYGSYSRGYRSGGWTTRLSNPLLAAPEFGPEKAESFEAGLKSQFLDRKLQLNIAAFLTNYNGIQLNQQIGVSPTVANLGNARVKGFEVELVAAPTSGFTVTGSVGYLDAKYTYICGENNNQAAFCGGNSAYVAPNPLQAGVFAGAPLPKAPKWKMNISPRYETELGAGKLVFLADYTHTTSMRTDTEGTFVLLRQATDIVNGSISYQPRGGHWDITVGGTNLTSKRYIITGQAQIAGGEIYGTYNRPAEWYARLGLKF